ncbi:hypothetical protein U875_01735 [Pandoraea pnomenusa 3kgm]|nr:hypothetical protein U875_01735 [Pandoraea pnomenusa 3kgm]
MAVQFWWVDWTPLVVAVASVMNWDRIPTIVCQIVWLIFNRQLRPPWVQSLIFIDENVQITILRLAQKHLNTKPVLIAKVLSLIDDNRVKFFFQYIRRQCQSIRHLNIKPILFSCTRVRLSSFL